MLCPHMGQRGRGVRAFQIGGVVLRSELQAVERRGWVAHRNNPKHHLHQPEQCHLCAPDVAQGSRRFGEVAGQLRRHHDPFHGYSQKPRKIARHEIPLYAEKARPCRYEGGGKV